MTTTQAVSRPSSLTSGITSTFAVLGLIDIALAALIGYNALAGVTDYANPAALTASFGIAVLGLITLLSLAPARRGNRPALIAIIVTRVLSAAVAVAGFMLNAFFWSGPGWAIIGELLVIVATIAALVLLRSQSES
jgi:hypothetical protein